MLATIRNKIPLSRKRQIDDDEDSVAPPAKKSEPSTHRLREKNGLFILKDKGDASADIVAVHGLCGDAYDSWTEDASGKLWLRDFLPSQIPDARIMSYGYTSEVAFSKSVARIDDFAADLLDRLAGEWDTAQSKTRPIIFICHSLGGIVVKKALILAHERSGSYGDLLGMVKGAIFMGTPHRGSDIAYWTDFLARVLHSVQLGSATNTRLLPDLQANSKTLSDISTQFIERGAKLNIRTFYETEILSYMTSLVVDVDSACLNLPNELSIPIQANHRTMCKFSCEDEQKYKPVWKAAKTLVESAKAVTKQSSPPQKGGKRERGEKEIQCLRSLNTSNYDDHKRSIAAWLEGTCTWFLQHNKYLTWLEEEKSSLIWISGDPGCGKSVLSSFLIDELKSTAKHSLPPTFVSFFFCDDKVESQKNGKAVLCGLLHQIFSENRSLIRHAMPCFEASSQITTSMTNLWGIFKDVSSDPEAGNIICIIDALDECEEASRCQLIKLFVDYLTETPQHDNRPFLKVLMTSRPYPSIEKNFRQVPYVRLKAEDETEKISTDVAQVIKKRLQDFQSYTKCSDDTVGKIEGQLMRKADWTFLWVSVVLELLENSDEASSEALEKVVTSLPKELDGVYDSILQKIPYHKKAKAKKALTIIVGARRPLSLEELNIALSIQQSDTSIDDMKFRLEPDMERTVKGFCGPFVRVINSKVFLVHQTAKEFLVKSSGTCDLVGDSWKHCVDPVDANLVISHICIWYLLFTEFESYSRDLVLQNYLSDINEIRLYLRKHSLLDYAACNWLFHFREAQKQPESALSESAIWLYDTQSATWFRVYLHQDNVRLVETRGMTNLMLASYLGQEAVVKLLIDKGAGIDVKSADGATALYRAAGEGHEVVVRLLIDRGADIDVKDNKGYTALYNAAERGHKAVVELLIDQGADIGAKDNDGYTALHRAAFWGYEVMVGLLIDKGADIDAKDNDGYTALHDAADRGHKAVVELLIDKGADIDAKGEDGCTVLHEAADRGCKAVVELLIDKGADIDAKCNDGYTALHEAAEGGHEATVELLIDKGADIDVKGNKGYTALHHAAERGHKAVVELLIDKGANIDAKGEDGCTALHIAVEGVDWGDEVVRLLIDKGADIDAKCDDGYTALHKALLSGNEAVVGLLIDWGAEIGAKDDFRYTAPREAVQLLIKMEGQKMRDRQSGL